MTNHRTESEKERDEARAQLVEVTNQWMAATLRNTPGQALERIKALVAEVDALRAFAEDMRGLRAYMEVQDLCRASPACEKLVAALARLDKKAKP